MRHTSIRHRRTLAEVPRHFALFHFFLHRSFAIFTNINTMGVVGHGLSTAAHGRKTRPFRGNALVAHIMGDSPPARLDQIHREGGDLHNNSPGRFEGVVAATTWGNRHFL